MVTITGYKQKESKEGKPFIILELQGELVMAQSNEGRWYATSKKATITSTFNEEQARAMIGKQIPGRIAKVPCEEYEYAIPETGEVILLSHSWEYIPEGAATPLRVVSADMAA